MSKPIKTNAYSVEESYEKRLKSFSTLMLFTGILTEVFAIYATMTISAYMLVNPAVGIMDCITQALLTIPKNPLYFLPIDYPLFPTAVVGFAVLLMIFVMYTYEVKKIHHNINTLKGSAEWQSALTLTQRFADYE